MVVPAVAALTAAGIELNGLADEPLPPLDAPASTKSWAPETGAAGEMVATDFVSVAEPTIPSGSAKVNATSYVVPACRPTMLPRAWLTYGFVCPEILVRRSTMGVNAFLHVVSPCLLN